MTPAARLAAAIELLDAVIAAAGGGGAAADTIARRYFADRRYAGAKDRRAIRELVWRAIRACPERPADGRRVFAALAAADAELAALFDGSRHGPPPLEASEPRALLGHALPSAIAGLLYDFMDDAEGKALLGRAPVDIRINALAGDHASWPEGGTPLPNPLSGYRYPPDTPVEAHPGHAAGHFEVQDAGSQWIAAACYVAPGMTVIDLCAGAGGKTLALSAAMANTGHVVACDTDRRRLQQLPPRAARAGATNIETQLIDPRREAQALDHLRGRADLVLIDAPCSGSGTWRRNPEARWRITPASVARHAAEQARLLEIGAELVAPGGALVYAVCALTMAEGAKRVQEFRTRREQWRVIDMHEAGLLPRHVGRAVAGGIVLTPLYDATDGFFFARMAAP